MRRAAGTYIRGVVGWLRMVLKLTEAVCQRAMERAVSGQKWDGRRKCELEARRVELEGQRLELDKKMSDVCARISQATRGGGRSVSRELKSEWDVLVSELRTLTSEVATIDESIRFRQKVSGPK